MLTNYISGVEPQFLPAVSVSTCMGFCMSDRHHRIKPLHRTNALLFPHCMLHACRVHVGSVVKATSPFSCIKSDGSLFGTSSVIGGDYDLQLECFNVYYNETSSEDTFLVHEH